MRRLPIARAIGCAQRLASHPGKVLVRLQKDLEQALSPPAFRRVCASAEEGAAPAVKLGRRACSGHDVVRRFSSEGEPVHSERSIYAAAAEIGRAHV